MAEDVDAADAPGPPTGRSAHAANSPAARLGASAAAATPIILGIALVLWIVVDQVSADYPGDLFDLYPLYQGAHNLLEFGDAYRANDPDPSRLDLVGNAYPLPSVLLIGLPVAWMPPLTAGIVYTVVVGLAWVGAIRYARESYVWLLWWPMWDALRIQQPTAVVTVAALVAVGAARRRHKLAFVASLCLMAAKPQQTIVLILLLAWARREWWRALLAAAGVLLAATFIAQPGWIAPWVDQVQLRDSLVQGELWLGVILIPLGIAGIIRGWRLTGAAVASTGAAPWPIAGQYVSSIWPIGLPMMHVAVLCMGAWVGRLLEATATFDYWALPAAMILAMAVVLLLMPTSGRLGLDPPPHPDPEQPPTPGTPATTGRPAPGAPSGPRAPSPG